MKKILIVLITAVTFSIGNSTQAQISSGISFNTFYNELNPYGQWINDPIYGQVWVANQQGFEPYYDNGHWVFTSYGWTWVSDYPWGWAPFHYGRWAFTSYGWAWVPGYEWAPAWVGWCQNDGYYGWAPLSPGLGFNISFDNIPRDRWRFVQQQYLNSPSIPNYFIRPDRNVNVYNNVTIINNTQVINNTTYVAGPQKESVERATREKIETRQLAFSETRQQTRVDKKQVEMFRPDLKANQAVGPIQPPAIKKDERTISAPSNNTEKKVPLVLPQTSQQPVLTDQQKNAQAESLRRQKGERLKVVIPNQPVQEQSVQSKEIKKPQPAIQQKLPEKNQQQQAVPQKDIQRQNKLPQLKLKAQKEQQAAAQQKDQQMQNYLQQQKLQAEKEQQAAAQQQDLQRQNELQQQKLQAQKEQQAAAQQQDLQRQNEFRQQKIQQQNQIRQQQIQDQKIQQQQGAQEQRLQLQNEKQQRSEPQQQSAAQPVQERKPQQKTKTPF